MQWFIIGRDMHVLCVSSTDLQESLPIDDSSGGQEIVITNNVAVGTYDFTTDPKHEDAIYITEGNYIAFRDKYGKDRLYTIMGIDGEDSWDVHCEDIGLDLINEDATSWDYTGNPKTIEETLAPVIYDSGWEIGINEISEYKRATKFEGKTNSQLTRIGDICGNFECECEFEIEMKGANVTKQTINIYKTLGQDMTQQRFVDGINLISLRKSGSIEDLITCIRCYGREDENGNQITIADIEYDDGDFYTPKGDIRIYSREARKKWSRFRAWNYEGQGEFDGYINGTFEYDTDNPQELFNCGLSKLKERCEKKVSYEAKLYDLKSDIGDTIRIADNRFAEKVYLEARIQAVKNHYSVQGEDTGTLANYKILFSRPADAVKEALDKFKNQIVTILSSDVSYQVSDSGTEIPTDEWVENPPDVPEGKYLWSKTVIRYSGGKETVTYSASRNGLDGKPRKDGTSITILGSYNSEEELIQNHPTGNLGDSYIVNGDLYVWNGESWENVGNIQGPQGTPGIPGEDGKTPYIHIKYSNDGGNTFTGNNGEDPGEWLGQYTDFEINDSNDPSDYTWSKIKGDKGETGEMGAEGPPGADGRTTYFHVKYSANPSGYPMSEEPNTYIGTYVDFEQYDSDNYLDYTWSKFQGTDGIPGVNGEDGKTSYLHIKYSNDGGITFTENNGETSGDWIGQYVDFEIEDSTVPSDYKWAKIKGNDGKPGEDGKPGADGKPGENGKDGQMLYATSNSVADDPVKFAFLVEGELELTAGVSVTVLFTNENSADNPTLNINNTGSKPIITQGLPSAYWIAGSSVVFVYDGTNWQVASSPVYASKATVGNPSGNHVYLEDAVYLKNGTVVLAKFTGERVLFSNGGELWVAPGQVALNFPTESKRGLGFTAYVVDGQKDRAVISGDEIIVESIQEDMETTVYSHIGLRKDYGYDEYYTGDIWLGKEVYQKIIHVGAIKSAAKTIAHGITNIDRIWIDTQNSFLVDISNITHPFPRVSYRNVNQNVSGRASKTYLYIEAGTDANFEDSYVTLRYTKTI